MGNAYIVESFNSIKDYQKLISGEDSEVKGYFQFHQGLSRSNMRIGLPSFHSTFNSIKDYPVFSPAKPPPLTITFNSIKDYQIFLLLYQKLFTINSPFNSIKDYQA